MRLADFIEANTEPILTEWVAFAATSGAAGKTMDVAGLRDHALAMLRAIVTDLRTPQTAAEQTEKSKGTADSGDDAPDTPAEVHGAGRAASGFTLGEMVSEYRALRASVIRLWVKQCGTLTGTDLEDLMRFNEAIDQSTAESITRFMQDIDHSKEMFLAILGHDLRSPLGAVIMSSQFMLDNGELKEPNLTLTTRITRSARRMNHLVGDLLEFTRSRLGSGVPIVRAEMDLAKVAREAADEVAAAEPDSVIQFDTSGDVRGTWDSARISQVLTNLIANAIQHGAAKTPISVSVQGEATDVVLRVHNHGPVIPADDIGGIFDPLKRRRAGDSAVGVAGHLGLGLYIAERIVSAHAGTIEVRSTPDAGTTVTVHLPR